MKRRASTLIFLVLLSVNAPSQVRQITPPIEPPADFKGDGCSLFPDGDYGDCCLAHDREYFRGGTGKERRAADKRLYQCVKSKKGWQHQVIAPIMWLGVRIGAVEFLPTPFRWGFGQPRVRK